MLHRGLVLNLKTLGTVLSAAVLVMFSTASHAKYDGQPAPKVASEQAEELQGVGIDEKLGAKLDLSLQVKDEAGNSVPLSTYFDGKHPVILSPVYFSCPGLCNFHLNGLTDGLKLMEKDWGVGGKYQVISLSFDSKETPDLAATKKQTYMKIYDRAGAEKGWHFVTADEATVQAITKALGFKFRWDDKAKEWAHASAAVILTPDGTISRYLPGIQFQPQDIKLALNEATEGKIGNFVEHLVLYCFKYDPQQSKYTLAAFNVMQVGGAVMVLVMALWLLPVYIRSKRAKNKSAGR
ncbi:photosynthetic protein synthase I [Bdellovibrio bacteriovorus]|uniref:Photosynthetic protein synthase I n=1 Tax=Bdellovibrio bacteriovorus TaxID=959 RepID=A0A150WRR6_BDEBC|nr:SCO family protein [Bdellovibrio bacteriovorus]KYG66959.1 photosynthetic protein synthase I [Bdellovibrio bacteriovorus]